MDETPAVKEETQAAAPEQAVTPTLTPEEDLEAKFQQLEAEKNKAIEERENYKVAFLKEKSRHKEVPSDETEDERIRRIAQETLAESRLVQIAQEQDTLIQKALKENKELKLAQLNKTTQTPPAGIGSHTESTPVKDTLVTQDQLAAFKARGWSEKDIERYKKNLQKYAR